MKYFRIHTSDIAWLTKKPRGIFTTVGKLVEAKTMTEEEIAEYWKQRAYLKKYYRFLLSTKKEIPTTQLPGLKILLKARTSGGSLLFTVKCVPSMA